MAGIFTTSDEAKDVDEQWKEEGMPTNQATLKKMVVRQDLLNAMDPTQTTIDPVEAAKLRADAVRTYREMTKPTLEESAQRLAAAPGSAPLPQTGGEAAEEAAAGAEAAVLTDFEAKRRQRYTDAVLAATGQAPSYATQLAQKFAGTVAEQSMPALLEDMLGLENELKEATVDDVDFAPAAAEAF